LVRLEFRPLRTCSFSVADSTLSCCATRTSVDRAETAIQTQIAQAASSGVSITAAANAGVPPDRAGLAAGLLNASQQIGSALGLAILSALAIARTNDLIATHASPVAAADPGYHRALLVGSILMAAAAPCG
jgi:hypothetical protein